MIFDERLTELRKGLGITQKDFAEKLKIEPSKYNKWENGKTVPDFDTVIKLANFFEVTVDYLVGNSDARKLENVDINAKLGLSDGAIDTLEGYNKYLPGILIPIVNLLLELEVPAGNLSLLKPYREYTTLTDDEIQDRLEKLHNGETSPKIGTRAFDGRSRPYILSKIDIFLNTLVDNDSNTELYFRVRTDKRHTWSIEAQKIVDLTIIDELKNDLETLRIYHNPDRGKTDLEIQEYSRDLDLFNKKEN